MSNRTDFGNLAAEWIDYNVTSSPTQRAALVPRLEAELHNAFVAGQEAADTAIARTAPEMARLLLELQWSASCDGIAETPCCPVCHARALHGQPAPEHAADCALAAVLHAAGVM